MAGRRNNSAVQALCIVLLILILAAAGLIWRYKDTISGWFGGGGGADEAAIEVTFGEKTYTKDGGGHGLAYTLYI